MKKEGPFVLDTQNPMNNMKLVCRYLLFRIYAVSIQIHDGRGKHTSENTTYILSCFCPISGSMIKMQVSSRNDRFSLSDLFASTRILESSQTF